MGMGHGHGHGHGHGMGNEWAHMAGWLPSMATTRLIHISSPQLLLDIFPLLLSTLVDQTFVVGLVDNIS
jgi:hypothetical protein